MSMKTICPRSSVTIPRILFLVVWGTGEVMATFLPHRVLRRVDLPLDGLPTMAHTATFISITVANIDLAVHKWYIYGRAYLAGTTEETNA